MDVPHHAAVSETVEAARLWSPARSGGGFLNAALRRVSESESPARALSPLALWPDWLAGRELAPRVADPRCWRGACAPGRVSLVVV
jgi:hypothetical protein